MIASHAVDRRAFLSGVAAGSLVVAFGLPGQGRAAPGASRAEVTALGAFIRIGGDDSITVVTPCVEMGQGSQSALAVIVADELGADWSRVSVEMASLAPVYRMPGTTLHYVAGSNSVRRWNAPLRRSAAAAREMLVAAAASQWTVPAADCLTQDGHVVHSATGRRASFGALAAAAARLPEPADPALRKEASLVGRDLKRLDLPSKVDGSAVFGADIRLPGMVYAAIRQSPVFRTKVASVNAKAARAMRGVIDVVQLPDAVAVVADSYWRAQKAVDALDVTFVETPQGEYSSAAIATSQRLQLDSPVAVTAIQSGDAYRTLRSTDVISADYAVPYLYHATMETMTCTVSLTEDRCEYWVPTQWPSAVADTGARLTGLPTSKIAINCTLLGGAFGRKFEMDYVEQATLIAKAVRRPVQLIWSRQEDVQHGFYRPMMTARLKATMKGSDVEAMSIRVVGPSIPEFRHGGVPFTTGFDFRATLGISTETAQSPSRLQQYAVDNFLAEVIYQPAHVPCGSWRSVGASENGFFIESFIDELAAKAGQDPYQFRRHLLRKSPRGLAVLDKVVQEAGWAAPLPAGRHRGLAFFEAVGSLVAQVVEISVGDDGVKVHRVVCAIDCGTAVCPDNVRAQTEGCIVMGLSSTLAEQITIENGRCVQTNLSDYPVLRLPEMPKIEVHIIDSGFPLGGVAEAALPATVPALCNAVFAATGKRVRSLPIQGMA